MREAYRDPSRLPRRRARAAASAHPRAHLTLWSARVPPQERARNKALGVKEMEGLFREHLVSLGATAVTDFKALLNEVTNPAACP